MRRRAPRRRGARRVDKGAKLPKLTCLGEGQSAKVRPTPYMTLHDVHAHVHVHVQYVYDPRFFFHVVKGYFSGGHYPLTLSFFQR